MAASSDCVGIYCIGYKVIKFVGSVEVKIEVTLAELHVLVYKTDLVNMQSVQKVYRKSH